MKTSITRARQPHASRRGSSWGRLFLLGLLVWLVPPAKAALETKHPDFLTQHWLAGDGILENSAFGVAQTPDGYIWVASAGGLLRFNGHDFTAASQLFNDPKLGNSISSVLTDARGRLWLGKDTTIVLGDTNGWSILMPTNLSLRSVAVVGNETYLGTGLGEIYRLEGYELKAVPPPPGLTPSGIFCVQDELDGGLWLANRGFIGRRTATGWQRMEWETNVPPSIVACAARGGGLWVYGHGRLRRYQPDGTKGNVIAPQVEQPRQIFEDRQGRIWIASSAAGLTVMYPDGSVVRLNATNGLTHNSALMIMQDQEDNFWIGSSVGGLQRLRDRDFKISSTEDGLPDRIVKTVTTDRAGNLLLGTHGGGGARLPINGAGRPESISTDPRLRYVWSVCRDSSGREWFGTYANGLFVAEHGVVRPFPLPGKMQQSVYALMEDSRQRLWVGTYGGVGYICSNDFTLVNPPGLEQVTTRGFVEEPQTGAIWIGTFGRGLFRLDGTNLTHWGMIDGLPGNRVSSLTWDDRGSLWAGIFKKGLVCLRDGKITRVNGSQGLPADTIGAMLPDSEGFFWLGSDRGVLRVRQEDLRRCVADEKFIAPFEVFNEGDGLENAGCSEGFQPSAVRDGAGRLWFATLNGVVSVNPRTLHINPRPPPVKIEKVTYRDNAGVRQVIVTPGEKLQLPAGSTELEIYCAALSYAAPQKVAYAFQLEGVLKEWVNQGNERVVYFHNLEHGNFRLRIKAANNDGVWNETGATLELTVAAFFWQTWWFRLLLALALLGLGGASVAWLQKEKLQHQQMQLRQERALAEEQARLASVLEGTTDLVSFASPSGQILYINPAGRRLLGLEPQQLVTQFHLRHFFSREQAEQIFKEAIPQAIEKGAWNGQTTLQTDTVALPVSQVIVAHKNAGGELLFLSTIIRDVSERQRQEDELKKKNAELERFTYTVSHDLKSPLITIKGFAGALLGDVAAGRTARLPEDLTRIIHATEKMTGLLNGLLELSRIGRIINPPRPVSLQNLAAEVVELLNGSIQAKQARVVIASGLPIVSGDAQRLQEVLQNLVENALKFAQANQPPVIEIGTVAGAETPTIFVRDNGQGIEPRHLVTIFGLFNKLDNRTSGHGIGLALAQRIVEFHGGKIWAESAGPGQGATFYFSLPTTSRS